MAKKARTKATVAKRKSAKAPKRFEVPGATVEIMFNSKNVGSEIDALAEALRQAEALETLRQLELERICTDDHIMVGEHRCEICNCKSYEHAWWAGWDAVVDEPENDKELAEAEENIARRIPIKAA